MSPLADAIERMGIPIAEPAPFIMEPGPCKFRHATDDRTEPVPFRGRRGRWQQCGACGGWAAF